MIIESDLILVVDFEATCFDGCSDIDREIIEIGICCVDPRGGIASEYSSLVQPKFNTVSTYCTDITRITSKMVAEAPEFTAAIAEIRSWIEGMPDTPRQWISWGTYDYVQMVQDCGRNGITCPLPQHINAKKLFQKKFLKGARQVGLKKALEIMELPFLGQHHRALSDARALAQLVPFLLK